MVGTRDRSDQHGGRRRCLVGIGCLFVLCAGELSAREPLPTLVPPASEGSAFRVSEVLAEIDEAQNADTSPLDKPWWLSHTTELIRADATPFVAGVDDLLQLTLEYSAQVRVYGYVPRIRETAVAESLAAFDWSKFIDSVWQDTSEPVGSALTLGGAGNRFRDHNLRVDAGLRRRLEAGGTFELYQRFGHQNNNSRFFVPNDQGTARLVLGYTQPLLRGRGHVYNRSLIVLADIDVATSTDEYRRQLQSHLLEVAKGYWGLYLERANLAQKIRLYLATRKIVDELEDRQLIDAQRTQALSARAALESRRSDLVRARAALKNAETRLRSLINAPDFVGDPESLEIIPRDHPTVEDFRFDLDTEFATAVTTRPEIAAALKEIKSACVRRDMAVHEMLPQLNLVTETYVAGLRGSSRVGEAWLDQFRAGEPSYSVGLQYDVPLGRRAASARRSRRDQELAQMRERYRSTLELVRAEVEVAVREVHTAYRELRAKHQAQLAAQREADTLEIRWRSLANPDSTGSLLLESLLRAQERVTANEYEFAKAQLTYNLALINLRHANGTLLEWAPNSSEPILTSSISHLPPVDDQPNNGDGPQSTTKLPPIK